MRDITYGRLDAALVHLGFVRHRVEGGVTYLEKTTQTHVTLPTMPIDAIVLPWHLSTARMMVTGRGIAEATEFERILEQAA